MLPVASAAAPEHLAAGLHAIGGRDQDFQDHGAREVLLGLQQADARLFPGKDHGHEDHLAVVAGHAVPAGHQFFDGDLQIAAGLQGGRLHIEYKVFITDPIGPKLAYFFVAEVRETRCDGIWSGVCMG